MKVLVIGSGGREHAIVDAVSKSKRVSEIYCAPGNAGTMNISKNIDISVNDIDKIVNFSDDNKIDLVIVGPEVPLLNGIVDELQKVGIKAFGPNKKASIIEGSKEFAKDLMKEFNIPTAEYKTFFDYEKAVEYVNEKKTPIVIKFDGLAAGKGVVVAMNDKEAIDALKDMLLHLKFGKGGVVIEEFLEGPEFSLMAFVNGKNVYPMEIAQDHKRAFDGDKGPNTGGMGAYSNVPFITDEIITEAMQNIMIPTAKAMVKLDRSFTGILYGGMILTENGVKTIEFNARFGDPETEVILPRLENDIIQVIEDVLNGNDPMLRFKDNKTIGVVLASKGYPDAYEKGHIIDGLDDLDLNVYHMGTSYKDNKYINSGGRVLILVSEGKTFEDAHNKVYNEIEKIKCEGLFYRSDIAKQVIK